MKFKDWLDDDEFENAPFTWPKNDFNGQTRARNHARNKYIKEQDLQKLEAKLARTLYEIINLPETYERYYD